MAYALQGHVLPRPGRACTHHTTIVPNSVSNGSSNGNGNGSTTHAWQPPYTRSEPQAPAADLMERIREAGVENWEGTGLQYLSDDARARSLEKKANKMEKMKLAKAGHKAWEDVQTLGQLVREGNTKWEDLDLDDVDLRLKWAGLFHRRKRAPGTFMMRLKVPNGDLTSKQLRFLGDCIKDLPGGCGDVTTRANIQLRGITLAEADQIIEGLVAHGLSSVMSGMDNVRNITGSPIAGIDPHELINVRELTHAINAMHTNNGQGNPELSNLPRKLNIGLSPSRDDFPHTHINDVGLVAVKDSDSGEVGFNLEVGGYFSVKRNTMSMNGNTFVRPDQVVAYCKALLEVFRDYGPRLDRQKTRLMWLVEDLGVDKFRQLIEQYMGDSLREAVHPQYTDKFPRRDLCGVHPQKQEGLFWGCACVPAGRIHAQDFYDFARVADEFGDGTVRLTVEQDVLFPNIPEAKLEAFQADPLFTKFSLTPENLTRGLVSCTGSEFCGVAIIETKNRAMSIVGKLEQQLTFHRKIRMHWTGCPNSCGQVQVADIGLMGGPAKHEGKAVEGVRIFLGGTIGENPKLAEQFEKGIACEESVLLPKLRELLIEHFGASPKPSAAMVGAA